MPNPIIIWPQDSGVIAVISPNQGCGLPIEEIASRTVPDGKPYAIIDSADLPLDLRYSDAWEADFSNEPVVVTVNAEKKDAIDRAEALASLDEWFAEAVADGFVTDDGWVLGMAQQDVSLLTGNYVLAKEADSLGLPLPPVIDQDGVPHTFASISDMTSLMLAYGQARSQLSAEYAAKKQAILDGTLP